MSTADGIGGSSNAIIEEGIHDSSTDTLDARTFTKALANGFEGMVATTAEEPATQLAATGRADPPVDAKAGGPGSVPKEPSGEPDAAQTESVSKQDMIEAQLSGP